MPLVDEVYDDPSPGREFYKDFYEEEADYSTSLSTG